MLISTAILCTAAFVFLLLPGFVFLRAIWKSTHGPIESNNFYHYMIWGLLFSSIIYLIATFYFPHPHFKTIFNWLIGIETDKAAVLRQSYWTLIFSIWVTVWAWASGAIIGAAIIKLKMDVWCPPLRFKNEWYYLLSARGDRKIQRVYIEFMFEISSSLIIYRGTLADYKFSNTGSYVRLTEVSRTAITEWEKPIDPKKNNQDIDGLNRHLCYYQIEQSDEVLFKIEDMKNVNLIYEKKKQANRFARLSGWIKNLFSKKQPAPVEG